MFVEVNGAIESLLKKKNMTQKQLSSMTGITESAISRYISGDRVPRGVNLVKIAKALGTTTDNLLSASESSDGTESFDYTKSLIARNASKMSMEQKKELMNLLISEL